jgi:KGK domain
MDFLSDGDVISTDSPWVSESRTSIVSELLEAAREKLRLCGDGCDEEWLVREDECKVLRVGDAQGWRKGQLKVRLKIMLEFEPEIEEEVTIQPPETSNTLESPLDSLRS